MKVYCFDIDGTLCTNTEGAYEEAKPFPERIAQVNRLHDAGHTILLYTARGSTTDIDWRDVTEGQMAAWGVRYHQLFLGKPTADIYVDDKAFNSETWEWGQARAGDEATSVMADEAYLNLTYSEERAAHGPYPARLATWLKETYLPPGGDLLDVGCGRGDYLKAFSDLGFQVAGTDISPGAPGFSPDHQVLIANLDHQPMPYPGASFDVVFSKSVIEHTRTPDRILKKAFDALRPGGIAIFMTPSWRHTYWGPFYCDHTHVTPFTALSLQDAMTLAGFENVDVQHFFQLPFLWRYPALKPFVHLLRMLPIPFRPHGRAPWPEGLNKFIRFSNELMLLAVARKPKRGS